MWRLAAVASFLPRAVVVQPPRRASDVRLAAINRRTRVENWAEFKSALVLPVRIELTSGAIRLKRTERLA